ncbi:Major capsid protein Gp5 [uncultured Caudovirales phage]|uniref:Major capsid protein Gp5 n=1 Tax=uncultured Caudovirales phage TaxID=2100421 RepID=A0A6J5RTA0_9CAUD|nr:Major capsid protein Gp5 [uncultured Caudovirales phage]CAB4183859.1 Major capsid protein Gp5 [uncultured Caudovirales phage]CAB4200628.1 Major capsid protein Gp5 [uncultured Caudovirales phage]CAB4214427.1 Major capsid protein Gp5 [uncultured Caudovirales phage]
MANTTLTADIIASEAIAILENNCVMGDLVYRGYEEEFSNKVNGYNIGDTISIRRPTDFTVRSGATASVQDAVEGKFSLAVDTQEGVDFKFTSSDLTLKIGDLGERIIKPAMVQLANSIDRKLTALYKDVWNWVGTPGTTVTSFAGFAKAPERLDLGAVPQDDRNAVLSPTDQWGLLGSQTALYMQDVAKDAYRRGKLGMIGGIDTYSSQNVTTHTVGSRAGTVSAKGSSNSTTWASSKNTGTMSLNTSGWTASTTLKQGDAFTISTVFAVNPVTKATLGFLQQFVVKADVTADATSTNTTALTISPPIITSGAFQTVSNAPADSATITVVGTASTGYAQNLVFNKNAFSLVMVPMVKPPGAVDVARKSYKGYSVRVIPYYDGTNDVSNWRLDVLYGVKTVDARLATRVSGT